MKKLINISFLFLFFSFIGFFGIFAHVSAQTGAWISQTISQNMDGYWMYDCGETVAALTRRYSRYIYFFDINSSQWSVVDFGSTQTVRKFAVKGNCAMAYTDSLIVGYSGTTSQWDTLYYRGQVLDPEPSWSGSPSWGAGENLAWFVTDSAAYIFDAELGQWQTFQYSIPFTYQSNNGRFWSRGDYAGIILYDAVQNLYYNLAYSLNAHAFSELSDGGYYQDSDWEFDHGFVAHWDDGNTYKLIGYSAYTNQFAVVLSGAPPSTPTHWIDFDNIITNTVYVFSYSVQTSPPHGYTLYNYGFDTRSGVWVEDTWDYDIGEWTLHGWEAGGQIAMRTLENTSSGNLYTYLVFDGLHNSFSMHTPGVYWDDFPFGSKLGGTLLPDFNGTSIWFCSIDPDTSIFVSTDSANMRGTISAEDFSCVWSMPLSHQDSIELHIYNEVTQIFSHFTFPWMIVSASTPWLFVSRTLAPNSEVLFYSGINDAFQLVSLPTAAQGAQAKGELGAVKVSDFLAIYDATTNSTHTEAYSYYSDPSLGAHVAVIKKGSNIFQAYSSLTHQWYEFTIPDAIGSWAASDYLGRCESLVGDDRYYAFNGFYGNLVELQPQGNIVNGVNTKMGAKTILVVRDSIIYAFDPQAVTGISNPNGVSPLPTTFRLEQNYPNPFNPTTTITFYLPSADFVILKIYNVLGQEVETLLKANLTAGKHTVTFDASNFGSGVYFYNLKAGKDFSETKKMVLLR